jgi:hypothetical protein
MPFSAGTTPAARTTRHPEASATSKSSNTDLLTPASLDITTTRLSPRWTASISRSSWRHSACRPRNGGAEALPLGIVPTRTTLCAGTANVLTTSAHRDYRLAGMGPMS